jgi:hypothetical protein
MGSVFSSGYVSTTGYSKNADGTFTCNVTTIDTGTKTKTTSGIYIGVLNENKLVSPNSPKQMVVMSSDNKYIFIPCTISGSNYTISSFNDLFYYLVCLAFVNYNIKIPNFDNFITFSSIAEKAPAPDDPIYDNLSGDRQKRYKEFLLGQNPTVELLNINNDTSIWSDIGNISKSIFDLNLPDKTTNLISNKFCFKIDSTNVLPGLESRDCRSLPNASPIITKTSLTLDNNTMLSVGGSILLCMCCCSSMGICMFMMFKK